MEILNTIAFNALVGAMAWVVIYVNIGDFKRRAKMTPEERRAEDRLVANHNMPD